MMATLHKNDLLNELAVADPSWWSDLFTSMEASTLPLPSNASNTTVAAASTASLSGLIATDCGEELMKDSLVVNDAIGEGVSIKAQFFVLDRNGRPFLYLQKSSGG
jgi:hypothetical protein